MAVSALAVLTVAYSQQVPRFRKPVTTFRCFDSHNKRVKNVRGKSLQKGALEKQRSLSELYRRMA
jgi:hypothetical protein